MIKHVANNRLIGIFASCLVCLACLVATSCRKKPTKEELLSGLPPEMRTQLEDTMNSTPMIREGVENPQYESADETTLKIYDEVIGVFVGGSPKAFPLNRMSGMMDHVVNDVEVTPLGARVPFSITYCDLTNCARVLTVQVATSNDQADSTSGFTGDDDELKLGTYGLIDGGLAVSWQGRAYKQQAEIPGLVDLPMEKTTWGQWLAKYPESVVYVGNTER